MAKRRLSHRIGPPLARTLGPWVVRLLGMTWRVRCHPKEGAAGVRARGAAVYAVWHGRMLVPAYVLRNCGTAVMISRHADGEVIARIIERLGFTTVRGSSTRGGAAALHDALRHLQEGGSAAFTPDGPKGPLETVHPGAVYAAARAGVPLIPVGIATPGAKQLRSWDRFRIPKPFGRVGLFMAEPLHFSEADIEGPALEAACARLADALHAADAEAERLTVGG